MALWILRACFLLIAIGLGLSLTANMELLTQDNITSGGKAGFARWMIFVVFLLGAVATVLADVFIPRKRIDMISSVYFGLVVGLFLTYVVNLALTPLFGLGIESSGIGISSVTLQGLVVSFAGISLCYSCVSLLSVSYTHLTLPTKA